MREETHLQPLFSTNPNVSPLPLPPWKISICQLPKTNEPLACPWWACQCIESDGQVFTPGNFKSFVLDYITLHLFKSNQHMYFSQTTYCFVFQKFIHNELVGKKLHMSVSQKLRTIKVVYECATKWIISKTCRDAWIWIGTILNQSGCVWSCYIVSKG